MVVELRITQDPRNRQTIVWLKSIAKTRMKNFANDFSRRLAEVTVMSAKNAVRTKAKGHGDHPGQLENSIEAKKTSNTPNKVAWSVLASAPYAMYVEQGTGPHPIFMPGKGWAGGYVIEHPGAKDYPLQHFMLKAINSANDSVPNESKGSFFKNFR